MSSHGENTSRRSGFQKSLLYIRDYILDVLDLKKGVDPEATIEDIRSKSTLSGANSWMLMCSIVIASIGLGQNSVALIIGAMLISPLMSPILGIGLSVGINDMQTLRTCLIHFAIAIVIAVLTSYIYFELTPFKEYTSEISARTEPTFLDIFVAIFGGLAGIISIARKDISTTLPGVAIATALMPPLCVTGYGLAIGSPKIAVASFYLFFLNTFFVALSTYIIVRILNFPQRHFLDRAKERKNIALTIGFSLALIAPSFYIFQLVQKNHKMKLALDYFKKNCLGPDNIYLDSYTLGEMDEFGRRTLYLKVYGDEISNDALPEYESCLQTKTDENLIIKIISTSDVQLDHVEDIQEDLATIVDELESQEAEKNEALQILAYHKRSHIDTTLFGQVADEVRSLYPEVNEIALSYSQLSSGEGLVAYDLPTLSVNWNKRTGSQERTERLVNFLEKRLSLDTMKVIIY